jgi:hypothetical protein
MDVVDRATFVETMKVKCPACHVESFVNDDECEELEVQTDLVTCCNCGTSFSLVDFPPHGASFEQLPNGFRVGAPTRSWRALSLLIVPLIFFFAGFSNVKNHEMESLFDLLFLLLVIWLVTLCAIIVAGKVELLLTGDRLRLFVGIGSLGWSRNYPLSDFSAVRIEKRYRRSTVILLLGKYGVRFGSLLSPKKRFFVLNAVARMLREREHMPAATGLEFASQQSSTRLAQSHH